MGRDVGEERKLWTLLRFLDDCCLLCVGRFELREDNVGKGTSLAGIGR